MVLIYSNVIGNVDNLIIAAADNRVFTILFSIIITKSPHAILSCIDGISVILKCRKVESGIKIASVTCHFIDRFFSCYLIGHHLGH